MRFTSHSLVLKFGIVLLFLLCCLYAGVSLFRIVTTTAPDFTVYYGAARLLSEYKPLSGNTGLYTGFAYPPSTLLLFLPFVLFPYQVAQGIWVSVTLFLVPLCSYLTLRIMYKPSGISIYQWMLVTCLFFLSFPTRFTLGLGQINLLTVTFLLGFVYWSQQKKIFLASLALSLCILSKPHLGLILPFLFVIGYTKESILSFGMYGIFSLLTGVVFGFEYFVNYVTKEILPLMVFAGRGVYYNQSLSSFFSRIWPLYVAQQATLFVSVLLVSTGLFFCWRKKIKLLPTLSIFLPMFLLVEPLAWQHHAVFILPLFIWLYSTRTDWKFRGLLLISFILISANIKHPEQLISNISTAFLLSHVFLGVVCLFALSIVASLNTPKKSV